MFGYKRTFYPKRKRYYTARGPYSKYRRGTVGRAASGAAAAKRSDKTETYSATVNGIIPITLSMNQRLTETQCFHPFMGGLTSQGTINDGGNLVYGGALNDRGYRMKCATYDEVKVDSVKVTLTPAQIFTNNNMSFTLCTMWDRKASPKECGYIGNEQWMANGSMPTPTEIFNNEGTIKSIITGNQIYGYSRYCRASSIQEKGGYHDSSILYNSTEDESPLKYMYQDAWVRGALPFSPGLFLTIYSPAAFASDIIVPLSYKVEYTFTFRNPKSDLDWFCTVEAPGYTNPDMRGSTSTRKTPDDLNKTFNEIYLKKTAGKRTDTDPSKSIKDLFAKKDPEPSKDTKDQEDELLEKTTMIDTEE